MSVWVKFYFSFLKKKKKKRKGEERKGKKCRGKNLRRNAHTSIRIALLQRRIILWHMRRFKPCMSLSATKRVDVAQLQIQLTMLIFVIAVPVNHLAFIIMPVFPLDGFFVMIQPPWIPFPPFLFFRVEKTRIAWLDTRCDARRRSILVAVGRIGGSFE